MITKREQHLSLHSIYDTHIILSQNLSKAAKACSVQKIFATSLQTAQSAPVFLPQSQHCETFRPLLATKCDESNTPFGAPPRPIVGQSTIKCIKCHPNRPLRLTTILRSCQNVSCRARNQCGSERTGTLEKHRHGNGISRVPPNPTNLVLNNAE